MHYQVSRNGQVYGPYTLEDLQRYLASGNVLPSDLAKNEEMTEWLPVAQILGGQGAAGAEAVAAAGAGTSFAGTSFASTGAGSTGAGSTSFASPGYAGQDSTYSQAGNPAAYPGAAALAVSPYPDAPNLHWGLYLLLTIITCSLFSKVFVIVQALWLKKVQPNSNGIFFYAALYVLLIIRISMGFGQTVSLMSHHVTARGLGPMGSALALLYLVLLFVTRFVMSASLEEHFNGPEPVGLRLNPVMTFFFGGIYFQYHLNRINEIKQAARYGAGRAF